MDEEHRKHFQIITDDFTADFMVFPKLLLFHQWSVCHSSDNYENTHHLVLTRLTYPIVFHCFSVIVVSKVWVRPFFTWNELRPATNDQMLHKKRKS